MAERNLMLVGGIFHPFEEAAAALAALLAPAGVETDTVQHPDAWLEALQRGNYRMSTVYALRWRMLDHNKYEPYRDEWAYTFKPDHGHLVEHFVSSGGALLGLHTAAICFDTWPGWGALLGARWQWGISHHPPLGSVQLTASTPSEALPPAFELQDEVYHNLAVASDCTVDLTGRGIDDEQHPVLIRRQHDAGRVAYDALGHDAASLQNPAHRAWLLATVNWLLERSHA